MARDPFVELARDIEKLLGVSRVAGGALVDRASDVLRLDGLGFPGVSECSIYPDVAASQQLCRDATLNFPPTCCVCDAPVARLLAPAERKRWLQQRLTPGPLRACVPHCAEHAQREYARLVVHMDTSKPALAKVHLVGLSASFLAATMALQQQGDRYPPWRAFPDLVPGSSGWRQGPGEDWMQRAWNPFWAPLSVSYRAAYLNRWDAPAAWRAWYAIDTSP